MGELESIHLAIRDRLDMCETSTSRSMNHKSCFEV